MGEGRGRPRSECWCRLPTSSSSLTIAPSSHSSWTQTCPVRRGQRHGMGRSRASCCLALKGVTVLSKGAQRNPPHHPLAADASEAGRGDLTPGLPAGHRPASEHQGLPGVSAATHQPTTDLCPQPRAPRGTGCPALGTMPRRAVTAPQRSLAAGGRWATVRNRENTHTTAPGSTHLLNAGDGHISIPSEHPATGHCGAGTATHTEAGLRLR